MRSALTVASVAAALLISAARGGSANAEPNDVGTETDARAYFNAGARAYAAGKYLAAIRAFEEAYRVEPRPGLVFSIAQAYRRQYFIDRAKENLLSAIVHYRKYLELDPDGVRRGESAEALSQLEPYSNQVAPTDPAALGPQKPATQLMISSPVDDVAIALDGTKAGTLPYIAAVSPGVHHVSLSASGYRDFERDVRVLEGSVVPLDVALEEKPARISVLAPAGARIAVDGRFRDVSPAPPLPLAPGRHVLTVTANGHEPFSREIDVSRDEARSIAVRLPASVQRSVAWTLVSIGGAAVLTGGGLMTAAWIRERSARGMTVVTDGDVRSYDDRVEARNQLRLAGIVTAGSGVAIATLGAILYAFDEPRSELPAAPEGTPDRPRMPNTPNPALDVSAAPWFTAQGAGAVLKGAF